MVTKAVVAFASTPRAKGCTCGSNAVPALECVANRPIASHVSDALLSAGVEEVVLVGAANVLREVRTHLGSCQPAGLRSHYAVCRDGSDMVAALTAAAPLVGDARCIVHPGEGLLGEPLRPHLDALDEESADLILLCQRGTDDERLGRPVGRPLARPAPTSRDWGVGVFGPGVLAEMCRAAAGRPLPGLDGLVRRLSDDGRKVKVRTTEGWHRYQGHPNELLEINRLALDLLPALLRINAGKDNRIEGRVHIAQTASVTTSVIVGPAVVGEGAQVNNSYIGPYTSIGAQATIDGAEIERSIIAPGATVMYIGARLVSSLVGRRARVFRDFSLPRAMRLCVGEADEVALC